MTEKEVQKFVEFCNTEFSKELMEREAELISGKLSDHEKTLSIGCGIGSIGERIEDLHIVYLDSSRPMLLEAKKRVDESSLIQADSEKMPFQKAAFDSAYSVTALEFLKNPEEAVRETARTLKTGGRFLAMMLNPASKYFRAHVKKENSYFNKIRHHPKTVEEHIKRYFSTDSEYFLEIEGKEIFDTKKSGKASLYVVNGNKV